MLLNYFKIAFRNLTKNKLFSLINIFGMAISLAACLLIGLFVWDELKYDNYHPDGDRTFRVYNVRSGDDGVTNYLPIVPLPFAPYMQKDFPEIESTLRMMDTYSGQLFEIGDRKILENNGVYAEHTVFDMLSINVIEGSAKEALVKPNRVAISKSLATTHFKENTIGQSLKIDGQDYQVSAVFDDLPSHSHLKINYLLSFATLTKNWVKDRNENWVWQQIFTYLKLKPNTDAKALEAKFPAFAEKYAHPKTKPEGFSYIPHLQNIKDIHLHSSSFEWEIAQRGNAQTVYILSFTAVLLLIIASLNFINLSTSRSIKRMKEVGVRKVAGAARMQLIAQFIAESVIITFLGLVLSLVIVELTLPYLNQFAEKTLAFPLTPAITSSLVSFCIFLGAVAGSYPAFYLSQFKPAAVLYNKNSASGNTAFLRQGLVILQFMFSFFLIIGSMIVWSQNDLIQNKDMGFSKEQLIMIPLRDSQLKNYETTKQEFSNHSNILSATIGFGIPGDIIAGDGIINPVTHKSQSVNLFCIDYDYIKTMQMHVIEGRDFSRSFPSDEKQGFIINETAAKTLGLGTPADAIGKKLDWKVWGKDSLKHGEVIGVVKDFHFKSLREQMAPVVMHIFPNAYWKITMRIKPDYIPATIAHLKSTYERLDPEWPFTYKFVDENYDAMYRSEVKLSKLFSIATGIAIAVACLGLFGLVEYSVNQRIREIGIRKVFGASVNSLLILLTRKYFVLILIAFVIIIPISYYSANTWLSSFAYRIDISPWIYIKACLLIVIITAFTVSFQSIKAALTNPAKVLKNE